MKKILRILVPVDFSPESELALDWALMIAENQVGATLYLMHAQPLSHEPKRFGRGDVAHEIERNAVEHKMKNIQARLPVDVITFPVYETGPIPQAIRRVCDQRNIDLVVMTTRGRRGAARIMESSVSEEAVRLAPCPILVLHLNERVEKMVHLSKKDYHPFQTLRQGESL